MHASLKWNLFWSCFSSKVTTVVVQFIFRQSVDTVDLGGGRVLSEKEVEILNWLVIE